MGVLYTQALAARAQAWQDQHLNDKRSPAGLLELATIWAAIQGLPLPECIRQCQYSERAATIRTYLTDFSRLQNPAAMSDTKYQFAPAYQNESISDERYAKKVTADNLTDEDAEFLIAKGYGHVIIARNAAGVAAVGADADSTDEPDQDEPQPTEREQELQAQVEQAQALLGKEEADHEATTQSLEAVKAQYQKVVADYNTNIAALQSEKDAHAATKQQLSEVQKQLADATAPKSKKATAAPAVVPAPAPVMTASTTPVATSDVPASDATTANTDGTNSNGSPATV